MKPVIAILKVIVATMVVQACQAPPKVDDSMAEEGDRSVHQETQPPQPQSGRRLSLYPRSGSASVQGASFSRTNDCNHQTAKEIEEVEQQKRGQIFSIKEVRTDSFNTIDIQMVEACCQEFAADLAMVQDTLQIGLRKVGNEVCDCLCVYAYRISLPSADFPYLAILPRNNH